MFYKGYKQTKEHQANARKSRFEKHGNGECVVCGEEFKKYNGLQMTCSKRNCKNRRSYITSQKEPLSFLSLKLFSTIRMGNGKKEKAYNLLKAGVGKPCPYCGDQITLENASVDHKTPRTTSKVYDRRTHKMTYTKEDYLVLDCIDNLHIVCRNCNQNKGNMTDEQFTSLLGFLNTREDIKKIIFDRLKLTRVFFGRHSFHRHV